MERKPFVVLTGPTAVGKTALSIELAKAISGAIISADSMQVYKHMDIGSAKIMPEEMEGIRHYLVDEFEPDLHSEIEKIVVMDTFPEKWTYPQIQPKLLEEAKRRGFV